MDENGGRKEARELAQARYQLRVHLLVYVLVNAGLVLIWWSTGMGYFWPAFPIFFWGLGIVIQYMRTSRSGRNEWIDRETEKILLEGDKKSEGR